MADNSINAPQIQIAQAPAGVPMIGEVDGKMSTKMVPQDQVDDATHQGWENATKMIGPKGEKKWVPLSQVDDARSQQYAIAPDNQGVNKMVTPDGKLTYALPNEVDKFKASGHTLINPDGSYRVEPLPDEENTDTMARAAKVPNAIGKLDQQKAMEQEIHPYDPRPVSRGGSGIAGVARIARNGIVAPAIATGATLGGLAGGAELGGALTAPSVVPVSASAPFGGVGPSIASGILSKTGQLVAKEGLPYLAKAAGIGGGYYILNKILGK